MESTFIDNMQPRVVLTDVMKSRIPLGGGRNLNAYKCDNCAIGFMSKSKLTDHMLQHTKHGATNKLCGICKKRFFHTDSLLRHVKQHTSYRPYKCHLCTHNNTFIRRATLEEHFKKFHSEIRTEEVFTCHKCQTTFSNKYNLSRHNKKHNSDYICTVKGCESTFLSPTDLKHHLYWGHKGESITFCCWGCRRVFLHKEDLEKHQESSMCRDCKHCFADKWSLKKHLKTHCRKRFCCKGRRKVFLHEKDLEKHQELTVCKGCKHC